MPQLREVIEVPADPKRVFDAVADFSNSASWDPGVLAAGRIREGDPAPDGVGAAYELTVTFRGRASGMTYRTTEYERPTKVVLQGVGPRIAATDTIEFEPLQDGGTRITYIADLRLIGLAKVAEPFLGKEFEAMGSRALEGMRIWLGQPPVSSAP